MEPTNFFFGKTGYFWICNAFGNIEKKEGKMTMGNIMLKNFFGNNVHYFV